MPKKYKKRTLAEKSELLHLYTALPQGMRNAWLGHRKLSRSLLKYWKDTLPQERKKKTKKKAA